MYLFIPNPNAFIYTIGETTVLVYLHFQFFYNWIQLMWFSSHVFLFFILSSLLEKNKWEVRTEGWSVLPY